MEKRLHLLVIFCLFRVTCSWKPQDMSGDNCCRRLPRALDIDTFKEKVADGEDWVELLFFECPLTEEEATVTQFRVSFSLDGTTLTRDQNFADSGTCVNTSQSVFELTDTDSAVFTRTRDGVTRQDRYVSASVGDYIIWIVCRDVNNVINGKCRGRHFVSLMIRRDPPSNFPWFRAIWQLKFTVSEMREFLFSYVGEVCPLS